MALSETTSIDQITVAEDGTVFYREATRISKDGEQIAQTFHRYTLVPGQPLDGFPGKVVAIAQVAWTTEVVAAYAAAQAARDASSGPTMSVAPGAN